MTTLSPGRSTALEATEAADREYAPLLLLLTGVSGVVDAVSFLAFGRAFAAAQTGNLVFLGFLAVGAPGFAAVSLITSVTAFFVGAFTAGRTIVRRAPNRTRLLRNFALAELVPLAAAAVLAGSVVARGIVAPVPLLLGLVAFGIGVQAAGAARMRVPGLERTLVLTTTLQYVAVDSFADPENRTISVRWIASIFVLVGGAAVGAALLLHLGPAVPLAVATGMVAVVVALAYRLDDPARPRAVADRSGVPSIA